jgi:hypothetical protein
MGLGADNDVLGHEIQLVTRITAVEDPRPFRAEETSSFLDITSHVGNNHGYGNCGN